MSSGDREDVLRSALERLPVAVLVVDEHERLKPFNAHASRLFEREGLHEELVRARRDHPLALLIRGILDGQTEEHLDTLLVTFPGGTHYKVEPSRRSEKGRGRWLLLLVDEVRRDVPALSGAAFRKWELTEREAAVAGLIVQGLGTDEICRRLAIAPNTVKTHVRHLLEKSRTRNRTELVGAILRLE